MHCGFCLPACPTYRVTGSELDSPRGRIYLIRDLLERGATTPIARTHLDRCLSCRACEPACPSGVQYGRLADLGRELVERNPPASSPRRARERWRRALLLAVAPRRRIFGALVRLGQWLRPLTPASTRARLPRRAATRRGSPRPLSPGHARRMVVLEGCVQPALTPQVNEAAIRVLDRLKISLVPARDVGCCGALEHHLGRTDDALARVRRNVDACAAHLAAGTEAIVSTASGCGAYVKDYGYLLRGAPVAERERAAAVAAATRDLSEVVDVVALERAAKDAGAAGTATRRPLRVAWQAPCSLQHAQRNAATERVEALLRAAGCELVPVRDPTLCCGSAGSYSLLQPALAGQLRTRKLEALLEHGPDVIATANVGCQEHLRAQSTVPVRHWIELVDEVLSAG